jgi:hypothetical protein
MKFLHPTPEFQIRLTLLTPSELVWMFGDQFADGTIFDRYSLEHLEAKVSSHQLIGAIISTAFLVNEKNYTLHFDVQKKRCFFDLFTVSELYIFPCEKRNPWPKRSLEYDICYFVDRLNEDGKHINVKEVVRQWLGGMVPDPWKLAIKRIERSVYVWEKYDRHKKKEPILTSLEYPKISNEVLSIAAKQSISPIQKMLKDCQVNWKTIWRLMTTGINSGLSSRQEAKDWGPTEGM